jgi:hypothetical protein
MFLFFLSPISIAPSPPAVTPGNSTEEAMAIATARSADAWAGADCRAQWTWLQSASSCRGASKGGHCCWTVAHRLSSIMIMLYRWLSSRGRWLHFGSSVSRLKSLWHGMGFTSARWIHWIESLKNLQVTSCWLMCFSLHKIIIYTYLYYSNFISDFRQHPASRALLQGSTSEF